MTIQLDGFFIPMSGFPGKTLNYSKVFELSDSEFSEFYLKMMKVYKDKDGWWGDQGTPSCSSCQEEISSPKELRRYCGRSLHPNCFSKEVDPSKEKDRKLRKYFQRVLDMDSSNRKNN